VAIAAARRYSRARFVRVSTMRQQSDSFQHSRALVRLLLMVAAVVAMPASAADLVVSAAASLRDAFRAMAPVYESVHAGTHLVLNFAASDVLLKQIQQGAPADVFASADEATMDRAAAANVLDAATRRDFAGNTLVLVVGTSATAPARFADLATDPAFPRIAIGNPDSVPAGRYAREALTAAGLWQPLQPRLIPAANVRQALDYVARGEVQAGFVYATDAAIEKDRVRIALRVPTQTPVRYPIAVVRGSAHAAAAGEFVAFVASPDGRAILERFGFDPPTP
jgi:molybdate transport system substrate-binding protein